MSFTVTAGPGCDHHRLRGDVHLVYVPFPLTTTAARETSGASVTLRTGSPTPAAAPTTAPLPPVGTPSETTRPPDTSTGSLATPTSGLKPRIGEATGSTATGTPTPSLP